MEKEILLLGHPALYEASRPVVQGELPQMEQLQEDLRDTLLAFRRRYGRGRAIAAPQIGVGKRVIYRYLDTPLLLINPVLHFPEEEQMELWDDCMSFPGLYVRVKRYRRCIVCYRDAQWRQCSLELDGDMAELIQHEYDHLDGILATMRALDNRSLSMRLE